MRPLHGDDGIGFGDRPALIRQGQPRRCLGRVDAKHAPTEPDVGVPAGKFTRDQCSALIEQLEARELLATDFTSAALPDALHAQTTAPTRL